MQSRTRTPLASAALISVVLMLLWPGAAQSQVNRAPQVAAAPRLHAYVSESYGFRVHARDPEGARVRFVIQNKPDWLNFRERTGEFGGTPRRTGRWSNVRVGATDGVRTVWLPAFTLTVTARATNHAPSISGDPLTAVRPGALYQFEARAIDRERDPIVYSIANRPSWANFDARRGRLWGVPGERDGGRWEGIVISASDGRRTARLPAFAIEVTPHVDRAVALRWSVSDAVAANPRRGYLIHYGRSPDALVHAISVSDAESSHLVVENLSPGVYYFAIRSISERGEVSSLSNIVGALVAAL